MTAERVGRVPAPRGPVQVVEGTAELVEARRKLHAATPDGQWPAVLAEVNRLQYEQHVPPLAALRAVHAKLTAGWVPPTHG